MAYRLNPFTGKFDDIGSLIVPNNGYTYATGQSHSFTENYDIITVRSLDANFLIGYQVWLKQDVTISQVKARYTASIAGDSVVGLYDTNPNGTPKSKILQTPSAFNNAVTGIQSIALTTNTVVPAGIYWTLYLSSSTPTSIALNQNTLVNSNGFNAGITTGNNVWFRSLAYTATLPSSAGTGALGNYNVVPFFTFLTV